MTLSTKRRDLVGLTRFQVTLAFDDTNDIYARFAEGGEFETLAEAQGFAEGRLNGLERPADVEAGHWWARVEKGVYESIVHPDDVYGRILDASWEPDPDAVWDAHWSEPGVTAGSWEEC